ncbi:hypothetical protein EJ02DRAFT_157494 [Clathrospora elynae]|uniref:Heterokaryon incompatibility domain-containing protein n=1 Tax=Clathrospora elynae TaxID=706981 RepID=A0A6A5SSW8_9PLEO|nr:hypothetical protein EJ02DRAFT_157494 [Clathrospora elynae]
MLSLPVLFSEGAAGTAARKAFAAFTTYGNPWWERIWTLQEMIVPLSADFVWESLSVSRQDTVKTVQRLRGDRLGSFPCEFQVQRKLHTPLLRCLFYPIHGFLHSQNGDDGPMDLLMRWRHRKATDPRDKLYALLLCIYLHPIRKRYFGSGTA